MEIFPFQPATHGHLVPAITKLLHEAYAPLAAAGMNYVASWQDDARTLRRLEEDESFLFFFEDQVVGTVSLYEGMKKRSSSDYYRQPGVFLFGQFAIHPRFQGRGWGRLAMEFLEKRARERGGTELALDTAETAHALIAMYEGLGYRIVSSTQWPDVVYRSLILSKKL